MEGYVDAGPNDRYLFKKCDNCKNMLWTICVLNGVEKEKVKIECPLCHDHEQSIIIGEKIEY